MQVRSARAAAVLVATLVSGTASAQVSKDVSVVNTPTVNISASQNRVVVGNTAANPVPVVDARAARVPVQGTIECVVDAGASCSDVIYTVPADKRFVLQQVAVRSSLFKVTDHVLVYARTYYDQLPGDFPLALTAVPHTANYVLYHGTHAVTIYAQPSTDVTILAVAVEPFDKVVGSFSGYLEDLP
jgi:hypothetical protein